MNDELQGLHPAEVAAYAAVAGFRQTWTRWYPAADPDAVLHEMDKLLMDTSCTGQEMLDGLREPRTISALQALKIGLAFAAKAQQASRLGRHDEAWTLAVEAAFLNGKLAGFNPHTRTKSTSTTSDALTASEAGSRGGKKTHAESSAFEADTRAWCEAEDRLSQYPSLNKLCDAIVAARLNKAPRLTVRRWLTEWAKQWRAEGRWPH